MVNNKPRRIQIYYYCDEFAGYQAMENDKIVQNGYNDIEFASFLDSYEGI